MITTPKILTTLILSAAFVSTANAGIFTESFESAPGSTYTLSTAFDDGGFDYFGRYAVPDNSNGARDDFQNGWDGGFGIHSQDHDGEGGSPIATINVTGINIAGFSGLSASVYLGAIASEAIGFDNYEAADGDGIEIFASIDGGAAQLIGAFAPPAVGTNSGTAAGDLYLDTDLDGVGDGVALGPDLTNHSFAIAGTGSLLDISIELTSTGGFEPLALDLLKVSAVPEPSSAMLLTFGLVGLLRRRR